MANRKKSRRTVRMTPVNVKSKSRAGKDRTKPTSFAGKPAKELEKEPAKEDVKTSLGGALDSLVAIADDAERRTRKDEQDKAAASDVDEPGVVDLLGALKADIESLRQENEAFKQELMSVSVETASGKAGAAENDDVPSLLAALKDDIESLRLENERLRTTTFAAKAAQAPIVAPVAAPSAQDNELYAMLADLKKDIVSLRSENEDLRQQNNISSPDININKVKDVGALLRELNSDIDKLNQENENLRLENLASRDAHLGSESSEYDAYRHEEEWELTGLAKFLGAMILIALAGGGGYFLARMQTPPIETYAGQTVQRSARVQDMQPKAPDAVLRPQIVTEQPAPAPVVARSEELTREAPAPAPALAAQEPQAEARPALARTSKPQANLDPQVETAMLKRADGLMENRDLGAVRMVYVYLARKGSAKAMTRLARTYDLRFLRAGGFDELENADPERARRLYGVAAGMGDARANELLKGLQ